MKCLTICQPFAHLIMLPDDDDRAKRVENRTWLTLFRGQLLIHAGKSREWLSEGNYGIQEIEMTFGAIVGVCNVADCVGVKHRFGLVQVEIQPGKCEPAVALDIPGTGCFVIADIGMRMLKPRELALAQGFKPDYILPPTTTRAVAMIGNSVCPPVAEAIVRANYQPDKVNCLITGKAS